MNKYTILKVGKTYKHSNGSEYKCLTPQAASGQLLERISDSWTLNAIGIRMDEKGLIFWSYSKDGHWTDEERLNACLNKHYQ